MPKNLTINCIEIEVWAGSHIVDVIKTALEISFTNGGVPVAFTFNGMRYHFSGRQVVDHLITTAKEVK